MKPMGIEKFLALEKKYNLYEKEINGVNFWIYERFRIWNGIICASSLNLMPSQSTGAKGVTGLIRTSSELLRNSIFRGKIRKTDYDVCFIAHERRYKTDGHYECMYTEKLSRRFKKSITLEEPFERQHFKPVINNALYYTDYILIEGELYSLFHIKLRTSLYRRLYDQVKSEVGDAVRELIETFGTRVSAEEIYKILTRIILVVTVCRKKYERLICRISPKVIVEVVYYNAQNMMINEAAHKHGINTIELQHGTMHDEHIAYQYAVDKKIMQLPKKIFTFSEYWNRIIHIPPNSTSVIATGFPYFEDKVKKCIRKKEGKVKNILFLSQGTIGGYLFKLAQELDRILDREQYHIIYKLHPAEYSDWKERYGISHESSLEVIDNSNTNLYELFAKSSIQVGVYTTAVYEGIGFNLETYIYNIGHADTMKRLVDEGFATFVESAEELYEDIQNHTPQKADTDMFWKRNAFENIAALIEEELENT